MDFKQLYEKYIYRLTCCFFLTASAVIHINTYTGTVVNNFLLLFATLFFSSAAAVFYIAFNLKRTALFITLGTGAAVFLLTSYLFGIPLIETVSDSFTRLFYGNANNLGEKSADFEQLYIFISLSVIAAAATIILFGLLRFSYVRYAAGAALLIFTVVLSFTEFTADFTEVFLIFSFMTAVFCELFFSKANREHACTFLLPFIMAAGLFSALLPSAQTPIEWNIVKNIISGAENLAFKIGDTFTALFNANSLEFGISMTGYSESGGFFGSVAKSDKEALLVRQGYNSAKNLYLTGSVSEKYTGTDWKRSNNISYENSSDENIREYELDYLETLLFLHKNNLLNEEKRDEIFSTREIDIYYSGVRTKSLFYPLKTLNIRTSSKGNFNGASLLMDNVSDENLNVNLKYLEINYGDEELIDLLRKNTAVDYSADDANFYKNSVDILGSLSLNKIPENLTLLLNERREKIKSTNTALPDTVRSEVYELAKEITAEYDNDYDRLKALEAFLSNLTYTLTPPLTTGDDIVYQFLFITKEGYCTHFATAFAVMARALGIPTRFVQGYQTDFSEKKDNVHYIIRNENAHAWAEAYIDGAGWIPFEPTPGFSAARYPVWEKKVKPAPAEYSFDPEKYKEFIPEPPEPEPAEVKEEGGNVLVTFLLISGAAVFAVAAAIIIAVFFNLYKKKKIVKGGDISAYYLDSFKLLTSFLSALEYRMEHGETFKEFSARTKLDALLKITPVHQKVRYSGTPPTENELGELLGYKDLFAEEVKKKAGRLKYLSIILK